MSFFESMPLGSYPAKGDKEVIPEGMGTSNPAFLVASVAGVSENHSSTERSLPTEGLEGANAEGAQWNDDEDATPIAGHLDSGGYDPNMSGYHPTEPIQDARAGMMNGFAENNDYMKFAFDTSQEAESRLCYAPAGKATYTRSFEDAQDMPLPPMHNFHPEDEFEFGADSVSPQDEFRTATSSIAGIQVTPVVRRA